MSGDFEWTSDEIERLLSDKHALQKYIDDAKCAAQDAGRVTGEPLANFIRRQHAQLERLRGLIARSIEISGATR